MDNTAPVRVTETRGLTALLTACVAFGSLSVSIYVPSMPSIADELHSSLASVQATLSLFLLGFASAQLLYGPVSDRFGRRPVLLTGLTIYVLASIACAFAPSVEILQLGRFLQGLGACCGPVVARAVVRDYYPPKEAAKVFSLIGTAVALAPALGPIIGGQLQVYLGWRSVFFFLAGFGVMMIGLSWMKLPETLREQVMDALKPRRLVQIYVSLLGHGFYMGNVLVSSLLFAGLFCYTTLSPFLFIRELGIRPDVFGSLMIFTVGSYAFGSFTSGRLVGRLEARNLVVLGATISLIGAVLLFAFSNELTLVRVIGPMMFFLLGFGLALPPSSATALQPFPRVAGSASALMGFLQMAVGGVASFLIQPLYHGTALPLGVMNIGLAAAALIAFALMAWPRMGPHLEGGHKDG
ncbi:multidrug effflux MFS transporter [Aestuariispira ectoiniformans]|uniref:multidrug effflux MFS transporter n=1 Tax=Aestuariispira ectoiniformans TaxID=2775080 RepID=UPI00223C1D79|nr:multidrug effflux MFS transporter [Aestuariispira ectoiniformans]